MDYSFYFHDLSTVYYFQEKHRVNIFCPIITIKRVKFVYENKKKYFGYFSAY